MNKCKELVYRGCMRSSPCSRNAVKDGYCKQHHPETVAMRHQRRDDKWEDDKKKTPIALAYKKIHEQDAQIKSLQDSIINACGRVIAETEHKPVNASELADLVIKSEVRENDIMSRSDMCDLFKEDRIKDLEKQLAAATEWRDVSEEPEQYGRYLIQYESAGGRTGVFVGDWECGIGACDVDAWSNQVRGTEIIKWKTIPLPTQKARKN